MIKLKSIGSDPEMFVVDKNTPIPAIGLVPGSKKEPFKISEHESVQVDNVAIEFNVKPTLSPEEFIESLNKCYLWMTNHLKSINPDFGILIKPSVYFTKEQLRSKEARMFGCEPDFNAWELCMNDSPRPNSLLRSCGGHIHLGIDGDLDSIDYPRLIRAMDHTVGIYCASICGDKERMKLYGKAGAFRVKPYGVEYRTPSNTWLTSEAHIETVFSLVHRAIDRYNNEEEDNYDVKYAIDNADMEFIKELVIA